MSKSSQLLAQTVLYMLVHSCRIMNQGYYVPPLSLWNMNIGVEQRLEDALRPSLGLVDALEERDESECAAENWFDPGLIFFWFKEIKSVPPGQSWVMKLYRTTELLSCVTAMHVGSRGRYADLWFKSSLADFAGFQHWSREPRSPLSVSITVSFGYFETRLALKELTSCFAAIMCDPTNETQLRDVSTDHSNHQR